MAVNHSRIFGSLASLSQVASVFVFTYVSNLIGLGLAVISGAFWMLEGLAADAIARDITFTQTKTKLSTAWVALGKYWTNFLLTLKGKKPKEETASLLASLFATVSAILMLIALFTATGPLGWAIAGFGILSGIFWYMSAHYAGSNTARTAQHMNKLAAAAQIICGICIAVTLGLGLMSAGPVIVGAIGGLGTLALVTAIVSAVAWAISYFFTPAKAAEPTTTPKPTPTQTQTATISTKAAVMPPPQTIKYTVSAVELSDCTSMIQSTHIAKVYKEVDPSDQTVKSVFTYETSLDTNKQIAIAKSCIMAARKEYGNSSIIIDGTDVSLLTVAIKICRQDSIPFDIADSDNAKAALRHANCELKTNTQSQSSSCTGHLMTQQLIYSHRAAGSSHHPTHTNASALTPGNSQSSQG